jgi:hypothetical protein
MCGPCRGIILKTTGAAVLNPCGTSTVTLRVVGGDEKGSVKSETIKYSREFQERLRWQDHQRPLVREGARQKTRPLTTILLRVQVWSGQRRDHGGWRISIAKNHYYETSSENNAEE